LQQKKYHPEVDNKSIIMFFKKGLRDSSLNRKLAMKNPRMLDIAKKYAPAEEAPSTLESSRRRKSRATWTSLAHPRATTRRGS
jgi:hypothetical protein